MIHQEPSGSFLKYGYPFNHGFQYSSSLILDEWGVPFFWNTPCFEWIIYDSSPQTPNFISPRPSEASPIEFSLNCSMSTGSTPALSRAPVPVSRGRKCCQLKTGSQQAQLVFMAFSMAFLDQQMVNCLLISPGLFEETKQTQKQSQEVFGAVGHYWKAAKNITHDICGLGLT